MTCFRLNQPDHKVAKLLWNSAFMMRTVSASWYFFWSVEEHFWVRVKGPETTAFRDDFPVRRWVPDNDDTSWKLRIYWNILLHMAHTLNWFSSYRNRENLSEYHRPQTPVPEEAAEAYASFRGQFLLTAYQSCCPVESTTTLCLIRADVSWSIAIDTCAPVITPDQTP